MVRTALLAVTEPADGPDGADGFEGGDLAARAVREELAGGAFTLVDYQAVPDEQAMIRAKLRLWADGGGVDLILTVGGVGLGLRERTPDATVEVIEREVPGLSEAIRGSLLPDYPGAMLSRGVAGVRRGVLIVNLPAEPEQVRTAIKVVLPALPAAVASLTNGGSLTRL